MCLDDQPVAALVAIDLGGVAHGVLRHAVSSAGETWVSIPATVASWAAGSTRAPYWMAMTPSITASAVPRVTRRRRGRRRRRGWPGAPVETSYSVRPMGRRSILFRGLLGHDMPAVCDGFTNRRINTEGMRPIVSFALAERETGGFAR
jgi:hypothetical protein